MIESSETIERSYAACRRLVRGAGSSFCPAFVGLSTSKRRAMDSLYAFMRRTDDLADAPHPADVRRQALVEWRAALRDALRGRAETPGGEFLPALVDAVERYEIPVEHLHAVIDGVEMDISKSRYETFDELVGYCERVASAVGLACIHVWGFRGDEAREPARKCGIALQLTNILRDIKEDAERGRVYLPLEDLRRCGYSVEDLVRGTADERFERLMQFEIGRAESYYREGAELIRLLEPDGRRVFGMIMSTYLALLRKIKRRPGGVLVRRVGIGKVKKLQIAARWMLLPPLATAMS